MVGGGLFHSAAEVALELTDNHLGELGLGIFCHREPPVISKSVLPHAGKIAKSGLCPAIVSGLGRSVNGQKRPRYGRFRGFLNIFHKKRCLVKIDGPRTIHIVRGPLIMSDRAVSRGCADRCPDTAWPSCPRRSRQSFPLFAEPAKPFCCCGRGLRPPAAPRPCPPR